MKQYNLGIEVLNMKVLQINLVYGIGSTGKIVKDINDVLIENSHESIAAYGYYDSNERNAIKIKKGTSKYSVYLELMLTRLSGYHGFTSKSATKKLLGIITEQKPDIIHLHNIHGGYLNIEILFKALKNIDIPIVWTLHDCWSFTGHCSHFDFIECDKWKKECHSCTNLSSYPKSYLFDCSKVQYNKKKELFTGVKKLQIITPSDWLADRVKESFLKNYDIKKISNGVDLELFRPKESMFRETNGLNNKIIILGVSSTWNHKKGLFDMIKLSQMLDSRFQVVMVGLNKRQMRIIPDNILGIERTNNMEELVEIYSTADIFVNASVEETMGLTTAEAMACGTPVIVYNKTAVPECVDDTCGRVVRQNTPENILDEITNMLPVIDDLKENTRAKVIKHYDKWKQYNQYYDIYKELYHK